ncbi:unnamed protein product [Anisakis simplex]|uniref:HEAT repeat-containing protein 1 n=1 Tax=Anisakis simplex TaxID=6269 RepID=A0A0M3KEZ7_ANISI|nr:unnamed protein product [Anisakis simplex]
MMLASDITVIVQKLLVRDGRLSVAQLADIFSFIFTVDKRVNDCVVLGREIIRIICDAKEKFVGEEVIQTISSVKSNGDGILLSLIALISTLIECNESEQGKWLAFLSMPWLTVLFGSLEVKMSTIAAIARMSYASEWRRIIFTRALESSDTKLQRTALEHFANFVHSIDIYAFGHLLDRILFIANSATQLSSAHGADICATVLKAIANSLCTLDTKVMLSENDLCAVCSQRVVTKHKLQVDLSKLFCLLETVICHNDKELRLGEFIISLD